MKGTLKMLFSTILVLTFGCKQKSINDHSASKVKAENAVDSLRNKLIGKWGGLNENRPVWKITKDSILYFETNQAYPYEFNGDTFYVRFPDRDTITAFGTISVLNDTLKIVKYQDGGFVVSAYRSK